MSKKILMVLPEEMFRDEEYTQPKRFFELKGYKVETASRTLEPIRSFRGEWEVAEKLLQDVDVDTVQAVVFVGGLGAGRYIHDTTMHHFVASVVEKGKVLGGLSFAPSIFAAAGLLTGKPATGISAEREELEHAGAVYTGNKVEVADNILTADGALSALPFAKAVVALIEEGRAMPVKNPLLQHEVTHLD